MVPALAGIIALLAAVTVATAGLGVVYAAREQAVAGADAAALAAAVATFPFAGQIGSPAEAARAAAAANGAALMSCQCPIEEKMVARTVSVIAAVRVKVPIFGEMMVRARSRAEFDPGRWLGV